MCDCTLERFPEYSFYDIGEFHPGIDKNLPKNVENCEIFYYIPTEKSCTIDIWVI